MGLILKLKEFKNNLIKNDFKIIYNRNKELLELLKNMRMKDSQNSILAKAIGLSYVTQQVTIKNLETVAVEMKAMNGEHYTDFQVLLDDLILANKRVFENFEKNIEPGSLQKLQDDLDTLLGEVWE